MRELEGREQVERRVGWTGMGGRGQRLGGVAASWGPWSDQIARQKGNVVVAYP